MTPEQALANHIILNCDPSDRPAGEEIDMQGLLDVLDLFEKVDAKDDAFQLVQGALQAYIPVRDEPTHKLSVNPVLSDILCRLVKFKFFTLAAMLVFYHGWQPESPKSLVARLLQHPEDTSLRGLWALLLTRRLGAPFSDYATPEFASDYPQHAAVVSFATGVGTDPSPGLRALLDRLNTEPSNIPDPIVKWQTWPVC
jgi:hypothetical protein